MKTTIPLSCVLAMSAFAGLTPAPASAQAQTRATFLQVQLDDATKSADARFLDYLRKETKFDFRSEKPAGYENVIDRLATWEAAEGEGHFIARVTPYALVAAELLGANLSVVGTYVSKATGGTTYHSYFVVDRDDYPSRPDLTDLVRNLKARDRPAAFGYHDMLSTSSYFLPALFFRENGIHNMAQSTERLTAIAATKHGTSSSGLVKAVANDDLDIAAVWDGTKSTFEGTDSLRERYADQVYFVQLPTQLPNDLLVASRTLDSIARTRLHAAIDKMSSQQIGIGDFLTWTTIEEAPEAGQALARLRWLATQQAARTTVEVLSTDGRPEMTELIEATRQAIRLSETELVNFDKDYHEHQDYEWKLRLIHDGALALTSRLVGSSVKDQEFQISFRNPEDLTRRIGTLIHSRLHRIRYLWPYRSDRATVLRDVSFSLPAASAVKVRQITWYDVNRNEFSEDREWDATVESADFHKFELTPAPDQPLDPMGNVAHRVVLVRPVTEARIFRVLTGVLVLLLVAAALAAARGVRRLRAV